MDHISQLPNNIIYQIQSLLSEKEATRTCILSKTWNNLCSLYPTIYLDYNKFIRSRYKDIKPDHDTFNKTFVDFVRNHMHTLITSQEQCFHVRKLYLKVSDKDYYNPFSNVSHWVEFLKQYSHVYVEEMCLDVQQQPSKDWEEFVKRCKGARCVLPCSTIVASKGFQSLTIKSCNFGRPDTTFERLLSNFASMKELHLRDVYFVDDHVFVKLMSCCPLIEVLELCICRSGKEIKTFRVPGFPMLKTMSIITHNPTSCVCTHFEIEATTLESFKNWGSRSILSWSTPEVCISIKKLSLKGLGGYSSNFFKDLETNFPLLEEAEFEDVPEDDSDQKITHHCIRTLRITSRQYYMKKFVIDCPRLTQFSYSGWGFLKMSMECSNLTQFNYLGNMLPKVGLFNSSLDIGRFEFKVYPNVALDTNWFVKLQRLVDLAGSNTTFLELEPHDDENKTTFVEDEEVKIYSDRKVNLKVRIFHTPLKGQSALVDGLLWSTHPTTLTFEGSRHGYCFIKHLCDKLSDMKSKDKPASYFNRKKWWHYIKDFEVESNFEIEDIKENLSKIVKLYERTHYSVPTTFKFHWINIT